MYTDCKLAESKTTIERKINIGNVLELNEVRDPPLGAGQIHVVSQGITVSDRTRLGDGEWILIHEGT